MAMVGFEVGKPFPGPVPTREGSIMELWKDGMVILIQMPGLSREERRAFDATFKHYSFMEASGPVPIAVWVFDFPRPHGPIDVNFDARRAKREYVDSYLDATDGIKNALTFFLLDGATLKGIKFVGLDVEATRLFHATIRRQLVAEYSSADFNRYLSALFKYSTEELLKMGSQFKHERRP